MKKYYKLIGLLLLVSTISLTSCEEDEIDEMFGDPVEKFLGDWKCYETGDLHGPFGPYDVTLERNPENSSEVLIRNFNYQGMDESARAIIAGNTITVPRQSICNGTIEVQGSGSFENDEINLNYRTNDGADEENIAANFYKP